MFRFRGLAAAAAAAASGGTFGQGSSGLDGPGPQFRGIPGLVIIAFLYKGALD